MNYKLEKSIWTERDFETMGWHDSRIFGLTISKFEENEQNDLTLDIDYIFQWMDPIRGETYFTFQVAPCTLVFHNVSDLIIDISTGLLLKIELEIDYLEMAVGRSENLFNFNIITHLGEIKLEATGYTQYVRQNPQHTESQILSWEQRGGISFERTAV